MAAGWVSRAKPGPCKEKGVLWAQIIISVAWLREVCNCGSLQGLPSQLFLEC